MSISYILQFNIDKKKDSFNVLSCPFLHKPHFGKLLST